MMESKAMCEHLVRHQSIMEGLVAKAQERRTSCGSGISLTTLKGALPLNIQKELRQVLQPLARDGCIPTQHDLEPWFEHAEVAVAGLGEGITVNSLTSSHINTLGPYLCGSEVWN